MKICKIEKLQRKYKDIEARARKNFEKLEIPNLPTRPSNSNAFSILSFSLVSRFGGLRNDQMRGSLAGLPAFILKSSKPDLELQDTRDAAAAALPLVLIRRNDNANVICTSKFKLLSFDPSFNP